MKRLMNWLEIPDGTTLLLRLLGRLHVALLAGTVCVMLLQVLYYLGVGPRPAVLSLFLRSLLAAVPAALSFYALRRCTRPAVLLAADLAIIAVSWLLVGNLTGPVMAVLFCFFRIRTRRLHPDKRSHLDVPNPVCLLVFGVAFGFTAFYRLPEFQRLVLVSAVLYLLGWLTYAQLDRVRRYLEDNSAVGNLPRRRVQRIVETALAALLLGTGLIVLPAATATQGEVQVSQTIPLTRRARRKHLTHDGEVPTFEALEPDGEETESPPEIFVAVIVGGAVLAVLAVRKLRGLRWQHAENGDEVVSLEPEDEIQDLPREPEAKLSRWDRSKEANIRRRYKKRVLAAAQEPPFSWQTPKELEDQRGIQDADLHAQYEQARYGGAP